MTKILRSLDIAFYCNYISIFRLVLLAKLYKAFVKMQLLEEAYVFILLMTMPMISSFTIDKSGQETKAIVNQGNIYVQNKNATYCIIFPPI